jgi:rubrerythrin
MVIVDDLLVEAMNSEIEAKKFYEDASAKAQSQAGKHLFTELAEFEQNHYIRVKKIYESLKNKVEEEEFEEKQEIPTINAEVEGEFEPNKDEIVTVLTLAIDAEKKAQEQYKNIASLIDNDYKNIFTTLAQEERNHQKILEDEIYQLSNKGTIIWE